MVGAVNCQCGCVISSAGGRGQYVLDIDCEMEIDMYMMVFDRCSLLNHGT